MVGNDTGTVIVSSGETEKIEYEQKDNWRDLFDVENMYTDIDFGCWSYEQLEEDSKPFLDVIKNIKIIPDIQYVVHYLLRKNHIFLNSDNLCAFCEFLREREFKEITESNSVEIGRSVCHFEFEEEQKMFSREDFEMIYKVLITKLDEKACQNGYVDDNGNILKINWCKILKSISKGLNEKTLNFLALVVPMKVNEYNGFLCKVLERRSINYNDEDEVFIYLALKYGRRKYEDYQKLRNLYKVDDSVLINSDELKENSLLRVEDKQFEEATQILKRNLDSVIDSFVDVDYPEALFETPNEELQNFLFGIKERTRIINEGTAYRTAELKFFQISEEIQEKWVNSALPFVADSRKEVLSKVENEDEEVENKVFADFSIKYAFSSSFDIKEGTNFCAETLIKDNNGSNRAYFEVVNDINVSSQNYELVEVKIAALTSENNYNSWKNGLTTEERNLINKLPEFVRVNLFEEENIELFRKNNLEITAFRVISGNINVENIIDILPYSKVRFCDKEGKDRYGYLSVLVKTGTYIPAGTKFGFSINGQQFDYEVCKFNPNKDKNSDMSDPRINNAAKYEVRIRPLIEKIKIEVKPLLGENEFQEWIKKYSKDVYEKLSKTLKNDLFEYGIDGLEIHSFELLSGNVDKCQILDIQPLQGLKFFKSDKAKNDEAGWIAVTVKNGINIEKGTKFGFSIDNQVFAYEVTSLNENKKIYIDDKKYIPKFGNLELVDSTNDSNDYITLYARTASSISLCYREQGESKVTVVCPKRTMIPIGTKIKYVICGSDNVEHEYQYELLDEINYFSTTTVKAVWKNAADFQTDNKDTTVVATNTDWISDIDGIISITNNKRIAIVNTNKKKDKDGLIDVSKFLRLVYDSTSSKHALENTWYKGFSKYGEDFYLNTKEFRDTKLISSIFTKGISNSKRLREAIITLKFIEFCWSTENYEYEDKEYSDEENVQQISDFIKEVNPILTECGFYPFYSGGFAYDAFIRLLLNSEDPLAIYQQIWAEGEKDHLFEKVR